MCSTDCLKLDFDSMEVEFADNGGIQDADDEVHIVKFVISIIDPVFDSSLRPLCGSPGLKLRSIAVNIWTSDHRVLICPRLTPFMVGDVNVKLVALH